MVRRALAWLIVSVALAGALWFFVGSALENPKAVLLTIGVTLGVLAIAWAIAVVIEDKW